MNIPVGIDFTGATVIDLQGRGFKFIQDDQPQKDGFRRFYFPLGDGNGQHTGFAIHVVMDETNYVKKFKLEHFIPFVVHDPFEFPLSDHANTVDTIAGFLKASSIKENDLREYLTLRKKGDISALHLKCRNFTEFSKIARAERMFNFNGEQAALLHLAPGCFDLLVTQK